MRIQEVVLHGFKSFAEEAHWRLPEHPGLYMIAGRNDIAPQLHSNGAGKSTLLSAIPWCFYGKTDRGLRGGEIASWHGPRQAFVEVKYHHNSQNHVMRRGINPGSLTLDGNDLAQDDASKAVGLNFECFSFAAMVGQFSRHFIDLQPAEKLTLFSFVLGLDYWMECAARAKIKEQEAAAQAQTASNRNAGVKGRYEEVADRLAGLDAAISRSRQQWEADRTRLEGEITAHEADVARLRREKAWTQRKVHIAQRAIDEAQEAQRAARQEVEDAAGVHNGTTSALAVARANEERLSKEIAKLKRSFPHCPECGQDVTRDHYNAELETRQRRLTTAGAVTAQCIENERDARNAVTAKRNASNESDRALNVLTRSLGDLRANIRDLDYQRQRSETDLRHVRDDMRRLADSVGGERQDEYEQTLENMRMLGEDLRSTLFDMRVAKRRERSMQYWATRGFRNLRLSIMEDALRQLESHVNADIATLGLDGWNVEFVVERRTKAGTLSHGMQTMITAPGTTAASKWETYCGGEVQRLRIATTIGMMKLVGDYCGVVCDCEFWDEPTAHLNAQGVNDLLEFLRSRARIEGKRIFIVDHRSLDSGLFDGVLTVFRDDTGSHLGPWA